MTHEAVFSAIARERAHQDRKWGTIEQHPHQVGAWLTLLDKELQEARDAWCSYRGDAGALEELLQVASLCVACLTQHGAAERVAQAGESDAPQWEVGAWIGVLSQRLSVARHYCCAERQERTALEIVGSVLSGALCCIERHGIVERPGGAQ